jgi:hypothetical protein
VAYLTKAIQAPKPMVPTKGFGAGIAQVSREDSFKADALA